MAFTTSGEGAFKSESVGAFGDSTTGFIPVSARQKSIPIAPLLKGKWDRFSFQEGSAGAFFWFFERTSGITAAGRLRDFQRLP